MKTDKSIFDLEALEKRKIASLIARGKQRKKEKNAKEKTENESEKPTPWHRKELSQKDFRTVFDEKKEMYYIRHIEWKPTTYMGPYPTMKEAQRVIKEYIEESKKPFLERHGLKDVHSYVSDKPIEEKKTKKS